MARERIENYEQGSDFVNFVDEMHDAAWRTTEYFEDLLYKEIMDRAEKTDFAKSHKKSAKRLANKVLDEMHDNIQLGKNFFGNVRDEIDDVLEELWAPDKSDPDYDKDDAEDDYYDLQRRLNKSF